MHSSRHQLLDEALAMTRRMNALADEGEWQAVVELEPQRRTLLEQAFATREPVDETLAQRVREILALDKVLMARSLEVRDEVAGELGQFNRSRKASNVYRANAL